MLSPILVCCLLAGSLASPTGEEMSKGGGSITNIKKPLSNQSSLNVKEKRSEESVPTDGTESNSANATTRISGVKGSNGSISGSSTESDTHTITNTTTTTTAIINHSNYKNYTLHELLGYIAGTLLEQLTKEGMHYDDSGYHYFIVKKDHEKKNSVLTAIHIPNVSAKTNAGSSEKTKTTDVNKSITIEKTESTTSGKKKEGDYSDTNKTGEAETKTHSTTTGTTSTYSYGQGSGSETDRKSSKTDSSPSGAENSATSTTKTTTTTTAAAATATAPSTTNGSKNAGGLGNEKSTTTGITKNIKGQSGSGWPVNSSGWTTSNSEETVVPGSLDDIKNISLNGSTNGNESGSGSGGSGSETDRKSSKTDNYPVGAGKSTTTTTTTATSITSGSTNAGGLGNEKSTKTGTDKNIKVSGPGWPDNSSEWTRSRNEEITVSERLDSDNGQNGNFNDNRGGSSSGVSGSKTDRTSSKTDNTLRGAEKTTTTTAANSTPKGSTNTGGLGNENSAKTVITKNIKGGSSSGGSSREMPNTIYQTSANNKNVIEGSGNDAGWSESQAVTTSIKTANDENRYPSGRGGSGSINFDKRSDNRSGIHNRNSNRQNSGQTYSSTLNDGYLPFNFGDLISRFPWFFKPNYIENHVVVELTGDCGECGGHAAK